MRKVSPEDRETNQRVLKDSIKAVILLSYYVE